MEWHQLEYFQMVARMQHMTRAAEKLSISQPALSRSIFRLEQELGVPLFERQGRVIRLNRYGTIFLRRVNRVLDEIRAGKQELQDLLDPEDGEVSLGFLHTLGTQRIPDLIVSFRMRYPKINFQLHQNNSQLLTEQLKAGEIDLCLVSHREATAQIEWAELWSEELFVIVPHGHKFAHCECITLQQVADEPIVSFKKGFGLRLICDQLFQEQDIVPNITFEGEEVPTVAGLVAAGLGIAVIPDIDGLDRSKLSLIRVSWPTCERKIKMAWVKGRYLSPAARSFQKFVINAFNLKHKMVIL